MFHRRWSRCRDGDSGGDATSVEMKAVERTQITVFLGNRPGVVADLCAALTREEISIQAMTVLDTVDVGTMRMIVDDPEKAQQALKGTAAAFVLVPVLSLVIPNRGGAFAEIAATMANAGINIEYVYATCLPDAPRSLGVFRVSDLATALKLEYPD
ncbi:MAG: ACT domain-containing protein [Phycisphaerales bacterium]|nr:ACT domain-containing protein [Phycisphaerales bacterium]